MLQPLGEAEAAALTERAKQVSLLPGVVIKVCLQGVAGEGTQADEGHNQQGCHHKVLSLSVLKV